MGSNQTTTNFASFLNVAANAIATDSVGTVFVIFVFPQTLVQTSFEQPYPAMY